ncbi:MAG: thioesterase family protein [Candidatus Promineifilaceae bacterium]|nr:thioesterase family protein [Candidatus Promineifilaceae bacterium]
MSASTPRPLLVELQLPVKYYDVDILGIVHNVVYIRWLEDLRMQLLAAHYPLARLMADDLSSVLERTEIDYRRPVRLQDEPRGRMWVSRLTRARWEVQAEISLGEVPAATALQRGYFFDVSRQRVAPVPAQLRDVWQREAGA